MHSSEKGRKFTGHSNLLTPPQSQPAIPQWIGLSDECHQQEVEISSFWMVRKFASWQDSLEERLEAPERLNLCCHLFHRQYQKEVEGLNLLCFIVRDIDSSETQAILLDFPHGGISPRELAAASARYITTSVTLGREFLSRSQQRWTKVHSASENQIAGESAGFSGRSPRTTDNPSTALRTPRNGVSPVRTWTV